MTQCQKDDFWKIFHGHCLVTIVPSMQIKSIQNFIENANLESVSEMALERGGRIHLLSGWYFLTIPGQPEVATGLPLIGTCFTLRI